MVLNLAELQQKADRVIHNADEFVRKWTEFLAAPAGNVTLKYYDRNGNLKTVTFSNRNKLVQDFIANVNSVMVKSFVVDQVNGNNGNDGSASNPLQTIDEAVRRVPAGGVANISIVGNYTLNHYVSVENKRVIIRLQNGAIFKNKWYQDANNNFNWMYGFRCSGFVGIEFILGDGAKILLDDEGYSTTVNIGTASFKQMIQKNHSCIGYVYVSSAPGWTTKPVIELAGVNSNPAFMNHGSGHSSEALVLHLWDVDIVKSGLGLLTEGDGIFGLKASIVSLLDGAGVALTWADVIGGIRYDATATTVPVNVISNVDL